VTEKNNPKEKEKEIMVILEDRKVSYILYKLRILQV
jgi:hypothetical protein